MDREKFEYYKNQIEQLAVYKDGRPVLQYASLAWQCEFWKSDPVELSVALMKEGYQILFDEGDSSQERERLQAEVEARYLEELAEEGLDLIDRRALLQEIRWGEGKEFCTSWRETAEWLEACIKGAARVEAEPVRRGRWIEVDSSYWRCTPGGGKTVEHTTYRCSECTRRSAIKTNYCPDCGAIMNKEFQL